MAFICPIALRFDCGAIGYPFCVDREEIHKETLVVRIPSGVFNAEAPISRSAAADHHHRLA
jgi:hypothetical protein